MSAYAEFLAAKAQSHPASGFEPLWIPDQMFGFQSFLTEWSIRMGRSGLFEDCGTGKSVQELTWAQNVYKHTGKPVLLLTRLGVAGQMQAEAAKFGIDAEVSRNGKLPAGVTISNYEQLGKFDRGLVGGAVCDESSAIKSADAATRAAVTGMGLLMAAETKITLTTYSHAADTPTPSPPGSPPAIVSGWVSLASPYPPKFCQPVSLWRVWPDFATSAAVLVEVDVRGDDDDEPDDQGDAARSPHRPQRSPQPVPCSPQVLCGRQQAMAEPAAEQRQDADHERHVDTDRPDSRRGRR